MYSTSRKRRTNPRSATTTRCAVLNEKFYSILSIRLSELSWVLLGRIFPMTKTPTPTEKIKKQHDNTKRHQKLRLHSDCGPT